MLSPWVDPTLRPILSAVPLGWSYTEAHPQCCPPGLVVHRGPWKTAPLEGREPRAAEAEVLSSTPGSPGSGAPVLLLLSDPLGRVRALPQGPGTGAAQQGSLAPPCGPGFPGARRGLAPGQQLCLSPPGPCHAVRPLMPACGGRRAGGLPGRQQRGE